MEVFRASEKHYVPVPGCDTDLAELTEKPATGMKSITELPEVSSEQV